MSKSKTDQAADEIESVVQELIQSATYCPKWTDQLAINRLLEEKAARSIEAVIKSELIPGTSKGLANCYVTHKGGIHWYRLRRDCKLSCEQLSEYDRDDPPTYTILVGTADTEMVEEEEFLTADQRSVWHRKQSLVFANTLRAFANRIRFGDSIPDELFPECEVEEPSGEASQDETHANPPAAESQADQESEQVDRIPVEKRTRPMTKREAVSLLDHPGNSKAAVRWLTSCIEDGIRKCEQVPKSSLFYFSVDDDWPEESRGKLQKTGRP